MTHASSARPRRGLLKRLLIAVLFMAGASAVVAPSHADAKKPIGYSIIGLTPASYYNCFHLSQDDVKHDGSGTIIAQFCWNHRWHYATGDGGCDSTSFAGYTAADTSSVTGVQSLYNRWQSPVIVYDSSSGLYTHWHQLTPPTCGEALFEIWFTIKQVSPYLQNYKCGYRVFGYYYGGHDDFLQTCYAV